MRQRNGLRDAAHLRRWGITYNGTGDLCAAVEAVEAACAAAGMACERQSLADGSIAIPAVQQAPWYRVLAGALPQRADWRLSSQEGSLSIASDFRLFRWYAGVVLSFLPITAGVFLADLFVQFDDERGLDTRSLRAALLLVAVLALVFWVLRLITALDGRHTEAVWLRVLAESERTGGCLAPTGRLSSLRYRITLLGFGCFVFALGIAYVISIEETTRGTVYRFGAGVVWWLAAVVILELSLVALAALLLRRQALAL